MTVAEMMNILAQFPPELQVKIEVDSVPKDDISFDHYPTEPELLYITR